MSRQVDVRALVSHIVRGDGIDKCRICMGDTTEGQVFLGDTVMLDGNRAVTLAELLETITGIEVRLEDDLPQALCSICTFSAMEAGNFRLLCTDAAERWQQTLVMMENIPSPNRVTSNHKSLYFVMTGDKATILHDLIEQEEHKPDITKLQKELQTKTCKKVKKSKRNTKLSCPDCGKCFVYAKHMHLHFEQSAELKRCCHICAKVMDRDDLIKHLADKHDKKCYPCKKCPAILLKLDHYLEHKVKSHGPSSHGCADCGRTFQSKYALIAHTGVHSAKTCPGCDLVFRNQMCYLYHVKQCCHLDTAREDAHRTKTKVMIEVKNAKSEQKIKVGLRGSRDSVCFCDYCGKKFSGKKFVAAHIQIVHLKNTHRPCVYCGKLLAAAHMTEHVKKHEQIISFTCERCGLILRSKLGYVQHLRLHTGEMPYSCKFCGERFSASSRRSEHIRKTHKSAEIVLKHVCKFCSARFRLPYKLRRHVETAHSEEADTGKPHFLCKTCGEKFGSCRGLVHHSRKHQAYPVKVLTKPAKLGDVKYSC